MLRVLDVDTSDCELLPQALPLDVRMHIATFYWNLYEDEMIRLYRPVRHARQFYWVSDEDGNLTKSYLSETVCINPTVSILKRYCSFFGGSVTATTYTELHTERGIWLKGNWLDDSSPDFDRQHLALRDNCRTALSSHRRSVEMLFKVKFSLKSLLDLHWECSGKPSPKLYYDEDVVDF